MSTIDKMTNSEKRMLAGIKLSLAGTPLKVLRAVHGEMPSEEFLSELRKLTNEVILEQIGERA
jgi:hypothetical protein